MRGICKGNKIKKSLLLLKIARTSKRSSRIVEYTQRNTRFQRQTFSASTDSTMETPKKAAPGTNNNISLDPNKAWKEIEHTQKFLDVPTIRSIDSKWNTPNSDCTRIVCMSDTHGQHRDITVPKGDILIHGGDFTSVGEVKKIKNLAKYFEELQFPTTVCIAGNHDMTLDLPYYERSWRRFHKKKLNAEEGRQCFLDYMSSSAETGNKFYYLEDSDCRIPIADKSDDNPGLSIYGSPWSAEFYDWAFNVPRGQPSLDLWSKIPTDTDVLVVHGDVVNDISLLQKRSEFIAVMQGGVVKAGRQ